MADHAGRHRNAGRRGRRGAAGASLALALLLALAPTVRAQQQMPRLALPQPVPAPPLTMLVPVPEDRIEAAVATLDDLGREIMARTGVPGLSIAVVHRGRTIFAQGFGVRKAGGDAPVDADTVFLLASLSKPVGATVVASQVGAGIVSWDSPVQDFLPWFDLGDPWVSDHVTIGDLYAHRSGLPDHAGDDLEDIGYGRREVLERLALLPMAGFRADYAYTNFGLTAAAEAVAAAAGTDWATLSDRMLYRPLGMVSTSSRHSDYMARDNRASGHVRGEDGFRVSDRRQPDAQSPAGGVSSSARDMARWMAMVLRGGEADGRQVIAADALLPAVSPQMISAPPLGMAARTGAYGFGFNVSVRASGRVMLGHSGAFALGASTSVAMVPDLDLGIVVLTNAVPTGAAEAIAASFLDRAELGRDTRDWLAGYAPLMASLSAPVGHLVGAAAPRDPARAHPDEAYTGTYANAYFGPATVAREAAGLVLRVGPADVPLAMEHWDKDSFVVHPVTENQPAGTVSLVRFTMSDGRASSMQVEHLDGEGLGLFERRE